MQENSTLRLHHRLYADIIYKYYHREVSKDINHSTNHVARVATLTSPVWHLYHQVHPAFQHHTQAFADYFRLSQHQLVCALTIVAILHDSGNGHGDTSACTSYEEKDHIWETLSAKNTETCIRSLHKQPEVWGWGDSQRLKLFAKIMGLIIIGKNQSETDFYQTLQNNDVPEALHACCYGLKSMLDIADAIDVARVRPTLDGQLIWKKCNPHHPTYDQSGEIMHQRAFDQLVYANTRMMLDQNDHFSEVGAVHVLYLQHPPRTLFFGNRNARKSYYTLPETQNLLDELNTKLDTLRKQAIPTPGWIQHIFNRLCVCARWIHSGLARIFSKIFHTIDRKPSASTTQSAHCANHTSLSTCKAATHTTPLSISAHAIRHAASTTKQPSRHSQHTPARALKRSTSF